jgi:hypothetical protein
VRTVIKSPLVGWKPNRSLFCQIYERHIGCNPNDSHIPKFWSCPRFGRAKILVRLVGAQTKHTRSFVVPSASPLWSTYERSVTIRVATNQLPPTATVNPIGWSARSSRPGAAYSMLIRITSGAPFVHGILHTQRAASGRLGWRLSQCQIGSIKFYHKLMALGVKYS